MVFISRDIEPRNIDFMLFLYIVCQNKPALVQSRVNGDANIEN